MTRLRQLERTELLEVGPKVKKDHPGVNVAIGVEMLERTCKPGVNVQAVTYRATHLTMLQHIVPQMFEPWTKDGELADSVFRAAAQVPMEWMAVGVVRRGLPFDPDDFIRRVNEAA
jgi:hypothetical protein